MPGETQKGVEMDLYVGAEPDPMLSEEVSGDRGDVFEPTEPSVTPSEPAVEPAETPPEPEAPVAETSEPEAPAPEAETAEPRIPKSRFDQVNERRKLAEQRMRELEAELEASKRLSEAPPEVFDFDTAEQQYMEAVVDGEFDKAKQIRTQIRTAERNALAQQALKLRDEATAGARQSLALDAEIAALQADFPIYDPEAEGYNEELTNEALDIHRGLIASGKYSPQQAIRKAAELVAKANGVSALSTAVDEPAPKAPARDTKPNFAQKVAAANAQPPRAAGRGKADGQRSVAEMTEDEFASLPESTKRKLRGDVL